jgi:hypothetical protein
MRRGIGTGIILIAVGLLALTYFDRNYSICQLYGAGADPGCETASFYHWGGISLLIIGAAVIAGVIISASRK